MSGGQAKSGLNIRRDLMDMVEEISFPELSLAADKIFPAIDVIDVSANYPVLPRGVIMKVPDTSRAPGGTYSRGQWEYGDGTYSCKEFGFEEPIDLVRAIEQRKFINEEEMATELAVNGLLLGREARVASAVLDTGVFAGAKDHVNISVPWDTAATATPWANIDTAYKLCRSKNIVFPKSAYSLAMSEDNIERVIRTAEVTNSVMYTTPIATMAKAAQMEFLRNYFGVKEIIPVMAMYDASGYGSEATKAETPARFWSNDLGLLFIRSSGRNNFKERCFGRQINYKPYSNNYTVDDYDVKERKQKIIRACEYRGMIINLDYGCLLTNLQGTVDAHGN